MILHYIIKIIFIIGISIGVGSLILGKLLAYTNYGWNYFCFGIDIIMTTLAITGIMSVVFLLIKRIK